MVDKVYDYEFSGIVLFSNNELSNLELGLVFLQRLNQYQRTWISGNESFWLLMKEVTSTYCTRWPKRFFRLQRVKSWTIV